jgi:hypothetical protein
VASPGAIILGMTRAEITPITGILLDNQYPQVIKNKSGNLACAFTVTGEQARQVGQDFAQNIIESKPSSATELSKTLNNLIQQIKSQGCDLQMSCSLFLEKKVVFASFNAKVLLKRNVQVGQVLSSDQELKLIEGESLTNDIVVLATKDTGVEEIKQGLLQNSSISTLTNKLKANIQTNQNLALAFVVPIFDIEEKIKTPLQSREPENKPSYSEAITDKSTKASDGKRVIIEDLKPKKKINFKFIGIILSILIILGSLGGYYYYSNQKAEQEKIVLEQQLSPIQNLLSKAESIKNSDPITAREKTSQVINDLNNLAGLYQENKTLSNQIQDEITKAEDFSASITGKEEVDSLSLFFDLKLVDSDFIATTADTDGENIYFLDTNNNQVIKLNLEKKQSLILPIGEQQSLTDLAVGEKYLYLLGEGLLKYDKAGEFPAIEIEDQETVNTNQQQMLANFGPFLYVFNSDEKNIYKVDSETKEEVRSWFDSDTGIDFDQVKSITIDGDIWLTTKQGEIKKFTQGDEQNFDVTGLDNPFNSPITLFTKDNLENLYVLEPKHKRVVILTKKGEFLREIKSHSLEKTTSLVVSEELEKIYALSGSIIFEINL